MKNVYRKKVAVVSNANQKKRRENHNLLYLAVVGVWNLLVLPVLFCFVVFFISFWYFIIIIISFLPPLVSLLQN